MMESSSRRMLLGLVGAGAGGLIAGADAAAARVPAPGAGGPPSPPAMVRSIPGRAELVRLPAVDGEACFVDEGDRAGIWIWRKGDFADRVRGDPLQGLVIPHAEIPPAAGAWLRQWDGHIGRPEWFGARANAPDFDCRPALQATVDLCPSVQMGSGAYHVSGRIQFLRSGTHLFGAGITQTDQGSNVASTQIVCTSASETILQIGSDAAHQPGSLVECVQLRDFTVRRAVAPYIPPTGMAGAIGIAMRWCVNCHIERVFSIDSARGWVFYGTVENYVVRCSALRGRQGSSRANDFFIGFHLDYTAPLGANGGNASLYIDHCRAFGGFGEGTPSLAYSAGLRTDGGWVDLYINALETGTIQYGIDGHGDAFNHGASFRTEDLIITNCVLDPGHEACIRLQTADSSSAVQISNSYMATGSGGTCIVLADLGGSISLTGNQCIIGDAGGTGLSGATVNNLRSTNNIFTKLRQPIRLEGVTGFHLQDTIHALDTSGATAGITLVNCTRGKIDCIVSGKAGALARGVDMVADGNSVIEVSGTNLDSAAFGAGPSGKLVSGGMPVIKAGPFGRDCLASGIMA